MMAVILAAFLCGILDRWRGSDRTWLANRVEWALLGVAVLVVLLGLDGALAAMSDWRFAVLYLGLFTVPTGWGRALGSGLANVNNAEYARFTRQAWEDGTAEWYQRGILARSWRLALTYRGFQWGALPALPLWYWIGWEPAVALTLAYTLAMPGAVMLSNRIEGSWFERLVERFSVWMTGEAKEWSRQELYRGWLVGGLLMAWQAW